MAVDKLVDSTQLDSDLTSVANAIRTKGGTSAQFAFPNGFVSAVNDIQTGSAIMDTFDGWQRPSAWPDIDSIVDNDFVGVILSYEISHDPTYEVCNFANFFVVSSNGAMLERGTIENGEFVAFSSEAISQGVVTVNESLPTGHGDYIVYRITTESGEITRFYFDTVIAHSTFSYQQRCIELYVCGITETLYANTLSSAFNIQHIVFNRCVSSAFNSIGINAMSVKKLELNNCTFTGNVSDLVGVESNIQSIKLSITAPAATYSPIKCHSARTIDLGESKFSKSNAANISLQWNSYYALQSIVFPECKLGNCQSAFYNCYALLNADLSKCDGTSITNMNTMFYRCGNLVHLKMCDIPLSISFSDCFSLSDDSLVSIANKLMSTVSGQTVTLHSTKKDRCSTLMGTVSEGVFSKDESGTVTLADFITNTKGWTLA